MKFFTSTNAILCGIVIVIAITFFQNQLNLETVSSIPPEQQFKPIENFFLQRSYPDEKFAINALHIRYDELHQFLQFQPLEYQQKVNLKKEEVHQKDHQGIKSTIGKLPKWQRLPVLIGEHLLTVALKRLDSY